MRGFVGLRVWTLGFCVFLLSKQCMLIRSKSSPEATARGLAWLVAFRKRRKVWEGVQQRAQWEPAMQKIYLSTKCRPLASEWNGLDIRLLSSSTLELAGCLLFDVRSGATSTGMQNSLI